MVYGQEERRVRFLHFVGTMTGKLQVQTNWTAFVFGSVCFWVKSSVVAISMSSFRATFCFPHKDLQTSEKIIFQPDISPFKSCSETEVQREHPPDCALKNFRVVFSELMFLK